MVRRRSAVPCSSDADPVLTHKKSPKHKALQRLITVFRQQYPWVATNAKPNSNECAPRRQSHYAGPRKAASHSCHGWTSEQGRPPHMPANSQRGTGLVALLDEPPPIAPMYAVHPMGHVPLSQWGDASFWAPHGTYGTRTCSMLGSEERLHSVSMAKTFGEGHYGASMGTGHCGTTTFVLPCEGQIYAGPCGSATSRVTTADPGQQPGHMPQARPRV
ncbi:hypothetical protein Purlil1_14377 [Purpureocillium lilacinum]|uniref:Uncharacterized protein n=1 Tax=Purpureocillium lilacinum TaxID=33203 RepID=A0ABR0BBF9_PURLI|nr:hypothetical protein Purlil1_14377 [Purpureocillium lilacinum]